MRSRPQWPFFFKGKYHILDLKKKIYESSIIDCEWFRILILLFTAYDRDPNKCSSMLYDPDMYAHFRDCFYNTLGIRMNPDVDTSAVTCV